MPRQAISEFKTWFEEYRSIWKSIEIRTLFALKEQEWIILKVMAYLRDTEPQQYGHKLMFDGGNLRAIVEHRSIDSIWDLVEEMRNGKVRIGDTEAVIGPGKAPQESSFGFYSSHSRSGRSPERIFPYFTLYLSLGSVHEYVDENEITRLLYSYGYHGGLQEFSNAKIGEPVGGSYVTYFGIIAPIYFLAHAELEPDYIKAVVLCGRSVKPDDVRLRYELYGKTEAEIIRQDEITFVREDERFEAGQTYLERKIAIPQEVLSARLSVFYQQVKVPADSFNILVGGAKATILSAFEALGQIQDRGGRFETLLDKFTQWLGVRNKALDADRFEIAVWALLTLAGLQTVHLGQSFGKGFDLPGVDLLAFHRENKEIVLISCTIENRLSNKIEPLLQQLNAVREKLKDWSVKGAIFAPIERRDVTVGSFADATEADISILLRSEIKEILDIIREASADTSGRTLELLKRKGISTYTTGDIANGYRAWLRESERREVM